MVGAGRDLARGGGARPSVLPRRPLLAPPPGRRPGAAPPPRTARPRHGTGILLLRRRQRRMRERVGARPEADRLVMGGHVIGLWREAVDGGRRRTVSGGGKRQVGRAVRLAQRRRPDQARATLTMTLNLTFNNHNKNAH